STWLRGLCRTGFQTAEANPSLQERTLCAMALALRSERKTIARSPIGDPLDHGTECPLLAVQIAYQSSASSETSSAATASCSPATRPVPVIGCGREGWRSTHA